MDEHIPKPSPDGSQPTHLSVVIADLSRLERDLSSSITDLRRLEGDLSRGAMERSRVNGLADMLEAGVR